MGVESTEVRTFVAIEIPSEVKAFLSDMSRRLKGFGGDVRWTRPEGIHITLKFLGNIKPDLVGDIRDALSPICARQIPFPLSVRGTGGFPDMRRPRVLWAGLHDPNQALVPLAAHVDSALESLGFTKEKRPFNPHLTLARFKSLKRSSDLLQAVTRMASIEGPEFTAHEATLFQSILKPTGAEYTALCRFPFALK
ncbi:MAG: RNA 2',3'-cyclic phosphodiesterase [Thermodesulfobacteriota bacterium]